MYRTGEIEVVIVGAGPVGLFTALALAKRGIRVLVADEETRAATHSYALALHARSLELLEQLGMSSTLLEQGHPTGALSFYEGPTRCAQVRSADIASHHPLLLVLPQSELERLLVNELHACGVDVAWNHRISDLDSRGGRVTCMIDHLTDASTGYALGGRERAVEKSSRVEAAFVIGADGHQSFVRRMLHVRYPLVGAAESFAVFEFHTQAPPLDEVRVVFEEGSASVLWPLPNGRCRWSFELADAEAPWASRRKSRVAVPVGSDVFPLLSVKQLKTLIHARAPWHEAAIGELEWSLLVRFERRLADRFGRDRFWLAGDAAHLAGPVGMHSLNMGLREGADLASRIHAVLREGTPLDDLEEYGRAFHREWRRLLGINDLTRPAKTAEPWVKRHHQRIAPCLPATGDPFLQLARRLGLELSGAGGDAGS